jgi:hypothetical protein
VNEGYEDVDGSSLDEVVIPPVLWIICLTYQKGNTIHVQTARVESPESEKFRKVLLRSGIPCYGDDQEGAPNGEIPSSIMMVFHVKIRDGAMTLGRCDRDRGDGVGEGQTLYCL